ncbi:MAG: hypothetical protein CM1200mP16_17220 [Nitrospina sp.]|nr:MAG: hypothetical protein CM1200mP16_17220 [Nitrospina sp.]
MRNPKAFLNKGLKIIFTENKNKHIFHYPDGIKDYKKKIIGKKSTLMESPIYVEKEDKSLKLETAFLWTPDTDTQVLSFANSIRTVDGGTHENGFRNGTTKAMRAYIERRKLLPKEVSSITSDDVREGLIAIINLYLQGEVEFQGQTKGRLNSDITSQVEVVVKHSLEHFLNENQTLGDTLANRIILSAQARMPPVKLKNPCKEKLIFPIV